MNLHDLTGCAPDPLAHYLKAVGILRLVSEQKDPEARGWWAGEEFRLSTRLDRGQLTRFFLHEYEPTPLVAPWNGGSGFYPKDSTSGIEAIEQSTGPRFEHYRSAILSARAELGPRSTSPKKDDKSALLALLRRHWRGPQLDWLEAAVAVDSKGEPAYPALFGTGGNDGRLDFTNNFMQRLVELLDHEDPRIGPRSGALDLLESALYGTAWGGLEENAVGQFLPGGAGGANNTSGYASSSLVNGWDYVLMLEGAVLFSSSVARDLATGRLPHAAAPFAVRSSAAGYGSAAPGEKDRGEQWMPLWTGPATLSELRRVVAEGRSVVGTDTATRPVDFGRAIARLGVARGLSGFQRYGYIERNGQANLAVSLGRWSVGAQPHVDLLDDVAPWVERLGRAARSDGAPTAAGRRARACEEAMLAACRAGADSQRWRDLLIALGEAEVALTRSPRFTAEKRLRPLPPLSPEWIRASAADLPELRLAVGLAAQHGLSGTGHLDRRHPVRRHFLPLDSSNRRFASTKDRLLDTPEVAATRGDPVMVGLSIVRRRLQEAGRSGLPQLPLAPIPGGEVPLEDIAAFLNGEIDEGLLWNLARPMMAIRWPRYLEPALPAPILADSGALGTAGLFHLVYHPYPIDLKDGLAAVVPLDPAPLALLAAGDLGRAANAATRRLTSSGLRPHAATAVGSARLARRIAASLMFPISPRTASNLARRLTHPTLRDPELEATDTIRTETQAHGD